MTVDDGPPATYEAGTVALLLPGHRERFAFAADEPTHHSWVQAHIARAPSGLAASLPLAAAHPLVAALAAAAFLRYAGEAHVSPPHVVRRIMAELGVTPMAYLWERRVAAGVDLLEHTGLSVGEVAARAGFKSVYHFSRRVKQHTGDSPRQLRGSAGARRRAGLRPRRPSSNHPRRAPPAVRSNGLRRERDQDCWTWNVAVRRCGPSSRAS